MGRLDWLKTVVPDESANEILPLVTPLRPNPFGASCAEMETLRTTGPALVSTDWGEMQKFTNCGGVVSAAAAPANSTNATTVAWNPARQRSFGSRSIRTLDQNGLVSRSLGWIRLAGTRATTLYRCLPGSSG